MLVLGNLARPSKGYPVRYISPRQASAKLASLHARAAHRPTIQVSISWPLTILFYVFSLIVSH